MTTGDVSFTCSCAIVRIGAWFMLVGLVTTAAAASLALRLPYKVGVGLLFAGLGSLIAALPLGDLYARTMTKIATRKSAEVTTIVAIASRIAFFRTAL